jgi:serine/threonine protein kinase
MVNEPNNRKAGDDGTFGKAAASESSSDPASERGPYVASDRTIIRGVGSRRLFERGEALVGAKIDNRFQIIRPIASGGTGEVFSAIELNLDRPAAIKILAPALASDTAMVRRFWGEVSHLSKIDDPGVVRYFSMGHDRDLDLHWIATEFIDGDMLGAVLEAGRWPQDATVPLIRAVANVLDKIHATGIIHRDINPTNILLRGGDPFRPVLLDFGIAQLWNAFAERGTRFFAPAFEGTLGYAAPEAFGLYGGDIGPQTDIYSLGLVAYELATGTKPFKQSTFAEAIEQRSTVPDLRGLEPTLAAALAQMLAPNPKQRFANAGQVLDAIAPRRPPPEKMALPSASAAPAGRRGGGFFSRIFGHAMRGPHGPGGSEDD